jgi:hypothetical protein
VLLIALFPDVKESPRYPEKPAGLADVAAEALRMLQHAQPGFYFPCLDLLIDRILHPEPPMVSWKNIPPVLDVY